MEIKRVLGFVLIFLGIVFALNAIPGITGFTISDDLGGTTNSVLGLIFVVGGILLWVAGRSGVSKSELVEAARWDFEKTHKGKGPRDEGQLKDYMRASYRTDDERRDVVEAYRESQRGGTYRKSQEEEGEEVRPLRKAA